MHEKFQFIDLFYYYSFPGVLERDAIGRHGTTMELGPEERSVKRKSRVSSEVHSSVVLLHQSPQDQAAIDAEVSEMFAAFGISEPSGGAADSADVAGGSNKNEIDVYSWDWDFPRSRSVSLGDIEIDSLNSNVARGA